MCMKLKRNFDFTLEHLYKIISSIWLKKTCHILDTKRMSTHIFNLFCHINPHIKSVDRAHSVRNRSLSMLINLNSLIDSSLKVSHVIHRVKYTKNTDAIFSRAVDKFSDYIITIVSIT